MASCSTIRARETCPVHIAKEHQNLCLFRTWYFGQIFHKQCTSISTSILFRQKYLDGYFSRLLPPLCPPLFLDRAPFLQTFHFYWWSTIFLSQEFTAIFIGVFFCHNALSWRWDRGFLCDKERIVYGSWSMKVCSLSVGLSVVIDSRILISWSLRNLFSHDVCRNE